MVPTFRQIIGQDEAIESIRRAYLAERLPHGLIFAGPVGVGKATTAAALGALYLCEKPKDDLPCGKCESCRRFETLSHPDYHVITKELIRQHDKSGTSKGVDLSIHVIRGELLDKAALTSTMNRGKVFVIEQAELMNAQAQNAMLKTLEEPSGRTLIIMLTDQIGSLLSTIKSRSQIVRFHPLDEKVVREQLIERGIDKPSANRAAKLSNGSLGLAQRWLADGMVDVAENLATRLQSIEQTGDAGDLADFFKKSSEAYADRQIERDELASRFQAVREALLLMLQLGSEELIRRMVESADDQARLERLCEAIDVLAQAERNIDANVTVSLLLQQLSLALSEALAPAAAR